MKTASFNSSKWCPKSPTSHSYLLPWQKYIVIASSSSARCRAITSRKETTQLRSGSADQITQGRLHSSLLPSLHLQKGHRSPCLTWRCNGISFFRAQGTPSLELKHPQPHSAPLANPPMSYSLAEGSSSVSLATTLNTDKGVRAIKKHLSCPSQCKKRSKTIYL